MCSNAVAFESHTNDDVLVQENDYDDDDLNVMAPATVAGVIGGDRERRRESAGAAAAGVAVSRLRAAMRKSRGILRLRRLVRRLKGGPHAGGGHQQKGRGKLLLKGLPINIGITRGKPSVATLVEVCHGAEIWVALRFSYH